MKNVVPRFKGNALFSKVSWRPSNGWHWYNLQSKYHTSNIRRLATLWRYRTALWKYFEKSGQYDNLIRYQAALMKYTTALWSYYVAFKGCHSPKKYAWKHAVALRSKAVLKRCTDASRGHQATYRVYHTLKKPLNSCHHQSKAIFPVKSEHSSPKSW